MTESTPFRLHHEQSLKQIRESLNFFLTLMVTFATNGVNVTVYTHLINAFPFLGKEDLEPIMENVHYKLKLSLIFS